MPGQLIKHSDAGSQYTAVHYAKSLALEGTRPSIGSAGNAYDNALMETINGLFKTKCIRTDVFLSGPYKTTADVEYAVAGSVDWYNNRRLHSTLDMIPPAEHEQAYFAALDRSCNHNELRYRTGGSARRGPKWLSRALRRLRVSRCV